MSLVVFGRGTEGHYERTVEESGSRGSDFLEDCVDWMFSVP